MAYGRQVLGTIGRSIQLTADGVPKMKPGGVTIDWSTVAAVSGSDATLADGVVVPIGGKYLRYGQVLSRITATGYYGPYDSAASGGRELAPVRGNCYLLNETVVMGETNADNPPVLDGGRVFKERIIMHATVPGLANGPTVATFEAAFPQISYAADAI